METNNRIFKIIISLVAILMVVGSLFVFSLKLDEPVFFDHYYDQRVYVDKDQYHQEISFDLCYITDAFSDRVVIDIKFPEYPMIDIQVSEEYGHIPEFYWEEEQEGPLGVVHGRYSIRSVTCKIIDLPEEKTLDGLVLKKAEILFSDSKVITVDIGEIYLYEHMFGESPLEHISSSAGPGETSQTSYRILRDITITATESPLMEKFNNRVQWKINGEEPDTLVGRTLPEGSVLEVTSKVDPEDDILNKYNLFDIHPNVSFTDVSGVHYSQRFYNIDSFYPSYSFSDLHRYIKAREAI